MRDEMTLNQYQTAAVRTMAPTADTVYLAGKLMCEAAEAAEPILKFRYHEKEYETETIKDELGDVLWYLAGLAQKHGLTLAEIAEYNIIKLRWRHGLQYDPEHYQPRL